jgi:hypothetical protein
VVAEASFGDGGGSLVDAYWRGRLPWMGVAEALIVVGATASTVAGTLAAQVGGGWIRRLVVVPPVVIVGLWWLKAMAAPRRAVPCNDCPPTNPDPWAYAYSVPETTVVFLLVPALVIVALALLAVRRATQWRSGKTYAGGVA